MDNILLYTIPIYWIAIFAEYFTSYKYKKKADQSNVIFGGRLAEYKYYDMHQIIASALTKFRKKYEILQR
jgi:UDP-galactopyranose mutase